MYVSLVVYVQSPELISLYVPLGPFPRGFCERQDSRMTVVLLVSLLSKSFRSDV